MANEMINESGKLKASLLTFEAIRWVGTTEAGKNSGAIIEMFQRAVDGKASQEPWCMAFAQYCIQMTDAAFAAIFPEYSSEKSSVFRSEHCLTVWNKSVELQRKTPAKGSLCIWQKYTGGIPSPSGHVGIVVEIHNDQTLSIVEGNTSSTRGERDGEGVFLKHYDLQKIEHASLRLKGFLNIWQ